MTLIFFILMRLISGAINCSFEQLINCGIFELFDGFESKQFLCAREN